MAKTHNYGSFDFANPLTFRRPSRMPSSADPTAHVGSGYIYAKTAAGATELYYFDGAGNAVQITSAGAVNSAAVVTNHALLNNLSYATAAHTGFAGTGAVANTFGALQSFGAGLVLSAGAIGTVANGILQLLPHGTGITQVGAAGTSHTLNTNNDLFVKGRLEVDGIIYADGNLSCDGWIRATSSTITGLNVYANSNLHCIRISTFGAGNQNLAMALISPTSDVTPGQFTVVGSSAWSSATGVHANGGSLSFTAGAASGAGTPGTINFFKTDGTTPIAIFADDGILQTAPAAAPTPTGPSQMGWWLDEPNDFVHAVIEYSDTTLKSLERSLKPHKFRENFMWTSGIYSAIWSLSNLRNGSGGSNVATTGAGDGGSVTLTTADQAGDYELTKTQDVFFSRTIEPVLDMGITLSTDLANKEVQFGLSDTPMGGETQYCYFFFDYTADNVNWWSKSNGTDASLAVGPTAGAKQQLRIAVDSDGVARFYVDSVLVGTVTGAVAATTPMYGFWSVKTEGATVEAVVVDHAYGFWD